MPVMNGYDALEVVKLKFPEIKVIALTMYDDDIVISRIIEKGANGFLEKSDSINLVIEAIESVLEKDYYFTEKVTNALARIAKNGIDKSTTTSDIAFTPREIEILNLICREYSAKEIACKINTSARTVEWHRNNILHKTKSKNTAGIVFFAVKNRLVV
jgi:DNA-binding NarL/FixJ family response regulator